MQLRKAAGLSQVDLSKALDVSRQAVSKWENGLAHPDVMNLIQLANLLDTDLEYLATGRRTYGRRPPVVIRTTETVEKIVEKPVVQTIEKPVIKRVYRKQYVQNPVVLLLVGTLCFLAGIFLGAFLL